MNRPIASLSLDLDNRWAYLRAAGSEEWESAESYLPAVIDRIVSVLEPLRLPLTVFLVGRDLENTNDVDAISSFDRLTEWEPANHSWNHLPWLHTLEDGEIRDEIVGTHERIIDVFDRVPIGFRGPGFSCPDEVLRVLVDTGYQYDASIFPTSMAPISRAVFLARTKLKGEQRERAKKLYGGFSAMSKPNVPYRRRLTVNDAQQHLWEIPVTVMPWTRTPVHFSYLTFLASKSVRLAKRYFQLTMMLCRRTKTAPSLLLHPTDFLSSSDVPDMSYFPGMSMPTSSKLNFLQWALETYAEQFEVHTMQNQLHALDSSIPRPMSDRFRSASDVESQASDSVLVQTLRSESSQLF